MRIILITTIIITSIKKTTQILIGLKKLFGKFYIAQMLSRFSENTVKITLNFSLLLELNIY